jgi:hypothetical protein
MDDYPVLYVTFEVHEFSRTACRTEHIFESLELARRFAQARTKELTDGWHCEVAEYKPHIRLW